jgi:hypothetical protein
MARTADLIDHFRSGWSERITSATCGGMSGGTGSRSAPLLHGRKRFAKHILKRQPFAFAPVKRPALGNLTHERRIAEDIHGLFEASVLMTLIRMAAGRPLFVTTTSSSRSCTPATSSGRRAFTSDNDNVLAILRLALNDDHNSDHQPTGVD